MDAVGRSDGSSDSADEIGKEIINGGWRPRRARSRQSEDQQSAAGHHCQGRVSQAAVEAHGRDDSTTHQRSFGCGTDIPPRAGVFRTSFAKKNFPSIGTIMICTLSERRSAMIF